MFFAKIDVIVRFKREYFVSCLREAVCYTYMGVLNYHLQKMCFYLGADSEFCYLVLDFLM